MKKKNVLIYGKKKKIFQYKSVELLNVGLAIERHEFYSFYKKSYL